MGTRLGLALLWLLHFLPLPALGVLGQLLATIAIHTRFARTTRINLHACFPEYDTALRQSLARRHLAALIRSVLELGILWWSPSTRIERLVRFKHLEYAEGHGRPVIFLTPHLVGLEMQGARMGMKFRGVGFFTPHKNPLIDQHIRNARNRLGDVVMLERKKACAPCSAPFRMAATCISCPTWTSVIAIPFSSLSSGSLLQPSPHCPGWSA